MAGELRAAILAAADMLEREREALCALDATTGDGDHGVTMAIGARNVRSRLATVPDDDPASLVRAAAMGMAGAGGAIGPIYGRGLLAAAAVLAANDPGAAGAAVPERVVVGILHECTAAAAEAVAALGGARPGDKTLLDALVPVRDALAAAAAAGRPLRDTLVEAREAASDGAAATSAMVAAVGRSSRFGERSLGSPDPGATSFALIVDALVADALGPAGAPAAVPDPADPAADELR